jgi:hypothetical protein
MLNPDDPITSIEVKVCTADRDGADTDSDVYVSLFPDGGWVEIDSDDDDFERGKIGSYQLPPWYFAGRIINDIRGISFLLEEHFYSGNWGLGWVKLRANGQFLYDRPGDPSLPTKTVRVWLEDGNTWAVDDFKPIEFEAPVLMGAGEDGWAGLKKLHDADSDVEYSAPLTAIGGRKPLTWELDQPGLAEFSSGPTLTPIGDTRQALLSGHTAKLPQAVDTVEWSAALVIKDADGRISQEYALKMRVISKLPPPTIASFDPVFGWPKSPPTVPEAGVVTVHSTNDDFDSRKPDATQVLFPTGDGGEIAGPLAGVDQITSSVIKVRVPKGAVPGPLKVRTMFGEVQSAKNFTAHPSGFRFLSGFPFANEAEKFFPGNFDWERYEETFGIDEMWMTLFDHEIIHDPVATLFFLITKSFLSDGCCHGFCLSSLQLQAGLLGSSAYVSGGFNSYPLDNAIWGLGSPQTGPSFNLSKLIQSRQLVVWSDEAVSYYLGELDDIPNVTGMLCEMDARPALTDVKASVGPEGWTNPRMIALARRCWPWEGHVVLPYATRADQAVPDHNDILVYDPNKPAQIAKIDDRKSYIVVSPSSGKWSYAFNYGANDANEFSGIYVFTIPFEQYGHQYDWSLPSPETLIGGIIMLGCAGTDENGRILQVRDEEGGTLIEQGQIVTDRTRWPRGARLIPLLAMAPDPRPLIALTEKTRFTWIVAPRGAEPTLLSIVRGPGLGDSALGLTVEEIETPVLVTHDAKKDEIAAAPVEGESSMILRIDRSFREPAEGLRWSVRVNSLSAEKPVAVRAAPDGRGVVVEPKTSNQCEFDVRLEHRDKMGRTRTLQYDGLSCPAASYALLRVHTDQLGRHDGKPLRVSVRRTNDDAPISELELAEQISTPVARLPARIVGRGAGNDLKAKHPIELDMRATMQANVGRKIQLQARGETLVPGQHGPRLVLEGGSRPVRLIAEDEQGKRSFPHELFVTIPEPGRKPVPIHSLAMEDVMTDPGTDVSIPVSCYVDGISVNDITFMLSARERLSGTAGPLLGFASEDAFLPAEEFGDVELEVSRAGKAGTSWLIVQVHLRWDASRSGLFPLGTLRVSVPPEMSYGSTFILRGQKGTAFDGKIQHELNVIPSAIRIWGGPEPSALSIGGPDAIRENETIQLELATDGIEPPPANCGWWITYHGGRAALSSIPGDPTRTAVTGRRAGSIIVHAVCGHVTAERAFRIRPTPRPNVLALASKLRLQLGKIIK